MENETINPVIRPSRAAVHVAVKNYLINELKITKASVMSEIEPLVREAVREILAVNLQATESAKRWVTTLIRDSVHSLVRQMVKEHVETTLKLHTKVVVEILLPKTDSK